MGVDNAACEGEFFQQSTRLSGCFLGNRVLGSQWNSKEGEGKNPKRYLSFAWKFTNKLRSLPAYLLAVLSSELPPHVQAVGSKAATQSTAVPIVCPPKLPALLCKCPAEPRWVLHQPGLHFPTVSVLPTHHQNVHFIFWIHVVLFFFSLKKQSDASNKTHSVSCFGKYTISTFVIFLISRTSWNSSNNSIDLQNQNFAQF